MKYETIQRFKQSTEALKPSVPVRVETWLIDAAPDSRVRYISESVKDINHGSRADRTWLANHCWWAMRNNRRVTTYPITAPYTDA